MEALIKLPNGDFVRPTGVIAVLAFSKSDAPGSSDHVVFYLRGGHDFAVMCDTFKEACEVRDEFAVACGAREGPEDEV
jgi:hypothetical protein